MKELTWPAWFNGPEGQSAIFESPDDVPKGWTSGAEKRTAKSGPAPAAPAETPTGAADLDADGHPYDEKLHAGTGSKTKDGKWRMKVGVKRPDPAPGYPLPLDL